MQFGRPFLAASVCRHMDIIHDAFDLLRDAVLSVCSACQVSQMRGAPTVHSMRQQSC